VTQHPVLLPAFAMVLVTIAVWIRMYTSRVAQMKRLRIHPQSVATSAQMAARIEDSRASDNFRNLFELPVLFYVGVLVAEMTGASGTLVIGLAWGFVVMRAVHSAIHCTYNKVMHRFYAYLAGAVVLWALWVALAFHLFAA